MGNYLFLILALLPFQVMTQTLISGTLKNYDRNFITLGKISDYELLSEMDTIFLKDGAFEVNLQLGGYHILAGDHLKSSLYQRFGNGSNSMVIPRYLFMKAGKLVNAFAAHPDDLEGLEAQVRVINE